MHLNFATTQALKDDEVKDQDLLIFRCDVKSMLVGIFEKLRERSNLKLQLIGNLDFLNPISTVKNGSSAFPTEMEGVLYEINKSKLLSAEVCDSVEAEFKTMVRNAKTYIIFLILVMQFSIYIFSVVILGIHRHFDENILKIRWMINNINLNLPVFFMKISIFMCGMF